jgi:ligand-binding sensor domain-containing protein
VLGQNQTTLWLHSLTARNDYSQSYNRYVFYDSEGFVWISSTAGLNRFDGLRMKQYRSNSEDSTALFDENIQSPFFEDSRQNIWFTTYQAIHCYDRKHDNFKHYFLRDKNGIPIKEDYKAFALEKDSFLWMICGTGLFRFNIFQPTADAEVHNISVLYENLWVSKIQLAAQEVYHIDEVIDISESSGSFFG